MTDSDNQYQEALGKGFENLWDLFVLPEVQKRLDAGNLTEPVVITAVQIILPPDDAPAQVRLNDEVKAYAVPRYKPGISKAAGEPVYSHELEALRDITLTDDEEPDAGHLTGLWLDNGWTVRFNFRRNRGLARKHLEAAEQFYRSAEFAAGNGDWRAFADNAFSAAELAAKALLLTMGDRELREKGSHRKVHARYNLFGQLGNADSTHRDTFNKLAQLRPRARYIEGDVSVAQEDARGHLETLREMIDGARDWAA